MAIENVRVYEIATATGANLANNEICNETVANATTGFKMWAGKNDAGNVTRWLALDKNAQVADLTVTGDITTSTGSITVDALSLSTLVANRILYGDFGQDSTFLWQNAKLRIGSTVAPVNQVDITVTSEDGIRIENTGGAATNPLLVFEKTSASPADNDGIGKTIYRSYDGDQSAPAKVDLITIAARNTDVSAKTADYKITVMREGVGEHFLLDENGFEISRGIITLKETTTPTAKQHHAKLYSKSDNHLYFQDGNSVEKQIATVGTAKAEMYMYDAAETVTINTQSKYHAVKGFTAGSLTGWTFQDGRVVDANITSEADNTVLRIVTSGAHSLTTGDIVTCTNMNDAAHNSPTAVTVIDATTFDCDDITYVAGAGASAGVIDEPGYLQAGAEAAGDYSANGSMSGDADGSDTYKAELFHIAAEKDNTASKRKYSVGDLGPQPCTGFIDGVVAGDRIWMGIQNTTGTDNFVITYANVNIHRL